MSKSFENNSFNNHFSLFGEQDTFNLDLITLEKKRKELLLAVHPDRFSGGSDGQQKLALQWTTKINEAFNTLKDPVQRALYLCKLKGRIIDVEKSKSFSFEFIEEQIEMRENLAKVAKDFHTENFNPNLVNEIESRASTMLSDSVKALSTLFSENFSEDQSVLSKIETQVNICLFAQKFILECFEVKRKFV